MILISEPTPTKRLKISSLSMRSPTMKHPCQAMVPCLCHQTPITTRLHLPALPPHIRLRVFPLICFLLLRQRLPRHSVLEDQVGMSSDKIPWLSSGSNNRYKRPSSSSLAVWADSVNRNNSNNSSSSLCTLNKTPVPEHTEVNLVRRLNRLSLDTRFRPNRRLHRCKRSNGRMASSSSSSNRDRDKGRMRLRI